MPLTSNQQPWAMRTGLLFTAALCLAAYSGSALPMRKGGVPEDPPPPISKPRPSPPKPAPAPPAPPPSAGLPAIAPTSAVPDARYRSYREGFMKRHLTVDGRALSWTYLRAARSPEDFAYLANGRRERLVDPGSNARLAGQPPGPAVFDQTYVPWVRDEVALGGDENPMLRGGLAMAALSMDYLVSANAQSLEAGKRMFRYVQESEYRDARGTLTGFMLRTRWPGATFERTGVAYAYASGDELSGMLLGLLHLKRALDAAGDPVAQEVVALVSRVRMQLVHNRFFILPPPDLLQVRQNGWSVPFYYQWFFEQAFEEIAGPMPWPLMVMNLRSFSDIILLPFQGEAEKFSEQVLRHAAANFTPFDRAMTMIGIVGMSLYSEGDSAKRQYIKGVFPFSVSDYRYFNFAMLLHLAQPALERGVRGQLSASQRDELHKQLRRVLRGVIFQDGSLTRIDVDRIGLGVVGISDASVDTLSMIFPLTVGTFNALLGVFNCCEVHVGSRTRPDDNYYAMAIAQAFGLMDGDSNIYFRQALPQRISAVRQKFGPALPFGERRDTDGQPILLGSELARSKIWSWANPNGSLLLRHNPQEFLGNGFCWEQDLNDKRSITGGGDGDNGLTDQQYLAALNAGIDVAREAAGIDYLLPTALLAYHVGGEFRREVVATQAIVPTFLNARTSMPRHSFNNR